MEEDPQKKVQKIYENGILPQLKNQKGEELINISLSREEFEAICDFFVMFAYN